MWLWLCPRGRHNSRTKMDKVRCLASHWDKLKEATCWLGVQEKDDVIFPRTKSVGNRTWGSGMSRATWITISCEKCKVCWKLISHLIIVCVCARVHACVLDLGFRYPGSCSLQGKCHQHNVSDPSLGTEWSVYFFPDGFLLGFKVRKFFTKFPFAFSLSVYLLGFDLRVKIRAFPCQLCRWLWR